MTQIFRSKTLRLSHSKKADLVGENITNLERAYFATSLLSAVTRSFSTVLGIVLFLFIVGIVGPFNAFAATLTQMSVTLSNNLHSASNVSWTSSFTTVTTGTVTTVVLAFSPEINVASSTLGTVSGIGSGSIGISGQNVTYTVTSPVSISSGTVITIPLNNIGNPSSLGNYRVSMSTTTGLGALDSGGTLAYLDADGSAGGLSANQVSISASVVNIMGLEVYSDTALTSITSGCGLGSLTTTAVNTCSYYLKPSTSATSGYTLTLGSDGLFRSGLNNIDNVPGSDSSISAGQERYGLNISAQSINSTISGAFNNLNYNIIPQSAAEISTSSVAITGGPSQRLNVSHAASISSSTAEGSYGQVVTYTIFAN